MYFCLFFSLSLSQHLGKHVGAQAPESVRSVLAAARSFFRQENVPAGAVVDDHKGAQGTEKLYFIGAGSVDLQVGGGGRRIGRVYSSIIFGKD